jgi:hypothetical protein
MVILQTSDLAADRRRLDGLGVRVVWEIGLDDIATVHLHPRDVGGAIVSLDEPRPATSWRWAGPTWRDAVRTDVVRGISGVTVAADAPERMAARWADVLGLPAEARRGVALRLEPGAIRFVEADERGEGMVGVALAAVDASRALATAAARGLRTADGALWIAGVRFTLAE